MGDYLSFHLKDAFLEEYRGKTPKFGFPAGAGNTLGEYNWLSKYSRRKEDGTRERFHEGLARVVNGVYSVQKDHCANSRIPWDEETAHRSAQEAYERAFAGKWSPPGRGLWMFGTELVNGRGDSSGLQNCFTGDTKFLTNQGIRTLAEMAGQGTAVWADGLWRYADIRHFGRQRVQRVTFAPRGIRSNIRVVETVTSDHRWELEGGNLTTALKVGDSVPASAPTDSYFNEEAFRHGLIFGDGSVSYRYSNKDFSFSLRLCGDKEKHAHLFAKTIAQPNCNGDLVAYHRSSVNMKLPPTANDASYFHSFILGWAAADGLRAQDDSREEKPFHLDTQNPFGADWLVSNAVAAGFLLLGHNVTDNTTNYGSRSAPLHRFTLTDASNAGHWTVKAIELLDEEEDVYCAVVPVAERFTLASGVYTSNCAFISTERIADNPTFPFMRLMSMSMVGVGVGFDTKGAGKVTLRSPSGVYPHVIPDSREGWVDSVGCLLRAYFTGGRLPNFDYSRIRPAGAPIRTFGGVASGPGVLKKFHMKASELLSGREGEVLTSTDIVDIQNLIGKCVVAGNVRRSAEIALGDPGDEEFLNLKDWNVNPERMGSDGWGHSSNNSVIATSGQDYGYLTERIRLNGEPGLVWLDVAQNYGRLSDPPDYKDKKLAGVNPCGEQFLEDQELCTLAESFPTNCADLNDYLRTLKFCFLYSKSVVLLPTSWEETNSVMTRNRRIGLSMTGIAQFAEEHGWHELKRWQDAGYKEIRKWDEVYSSWLGVRESIRVTTVKPSGTVSLLHGVTPGVHWPRERGFYVRTLRELKDSPLAEAMRDAGYPVEPSYSDPETTVVISVPVEGPDIRAEHEVSIWEKVSLAAQCQRWWSDNAVSVTITFREDEGAQIPAVLRAYDGQLKSVSFLPMAEGVYRQAPYQRVSREVWDEMRAGVKPVDWDRLYSSGVLPEAEGESYCSTDVCEIPR